MSDVNDIEAVEGVVRGVTEARFHLALHGCPGCGSRRIGDPETVWQPYKERKAIAYIVTCPTCGHRRQRVFFRDEQFWTPRGDYDLGGTEASEIIGVDEFAAELARNGELMPEGDLTTMSDADRDVRLNASVDARYCTTELRKFLPEGADEIPDAYFRTEQAKRARAAHPEWFTRAYIEAADQRFTAAWHASRAEGERRSLLPKDPNAKKKSVFPPFEKVSLLMHRKWLEDQSGERLEVHGVDATGKKLSAQNLTGVILDGVTLDRADLSFANLYAASLTDVRARNAQLGHIQLPGTTIVRSAFTSSTLALAKLGDATIEDCDFTNADLGRSTWYRAKVTRCTFDSAILHDAAFDHAVFTDCDFRGAELGLVTEDLLGTSFSASFIRCDLRDTEWSKRSLFRATFVDCKLAGIRGTPTVPELVIARPDLSPAGDGSQIGTTRDVLVAWGIDPEHPVEPYVPPPPAIDRVQLAEHILLQALDRSASFDDTIADLMRAGFTRDQAMNAVIDPARVK
jgi:uncharacterized protein YjbI with pentapeptide repeats